MYARLLEDETGRSPVPFWRALPEPTDTRLHPERECPISRRGLTVKGLHVSVRIHNSRVDSAASLEQDADLGTQFNRSLERLRLLPGMAIYALIKSVTVGGRGQV